MLAKIFIVKAQNWINNLPCTLQGGREGRRSFILRGLLEVLYSQWYNTPIQRLLENHYIVTKHIHFGL